jgi:hypothetical protein
LIFANLLAFPQIFNQPQTRRHGGTGVWGGGKKHSTFNIQHSTFNAQHRSEMPEIASLITFNSLDFCGFVGFFAEFVQASKLNNKATRLIPEFLNRRGMPINTDGSRLPPGEATAGIPGLWTAS